MRGAYLGLLEKSCGMARIFDGLGRFASAATDRAALSDTSAGWLNTTAPSIFPAYMNLNRLLTRGEMVEAAKAALQALGRPMNTRGIARALIRFKGWDEADKGLRQAVTYRLVQALTRAVRRKVLADAGREGVGFGVAFSCLSTPCSTTP